MRTFLSLVLFLQLCFVGVCFSADKLTETKLIRRAYIDMLGVLPTVAEVEWFTVYNNNGYQMVVEFLLSKTSKEEMRDFLLSNEYAQNNERILNIEEVMCIFLYLSGKKVGDIIFTGKTELSKQRCFVFFFRFRDNRISLQRVTM